MNITSQKNLKIFIFVLVAVITLGVGYATITAITLNINGGGSASAVQENFKVHFVNEENVTPTMTQGTGEAKVLSDTIASLDVTGLTKKGDTAKAVYTVINESNGVGAEISLGLTNSNTEYFKVTEKIDDIQLKAGETTLVTITIELVKTPIEDGIETTIQGILEASPIENEDVTSGKSSEIEKPGSFAKDSWATIQTNVRNGNINRYNIGDTKKVIIGENEYTVRIANKSTPNECNGENFSQTACGFVMEFTEIVELKAMDARNTNIGGWPGSELHTYLQGDFYDKLPSDLRSVIATTRVISGHGPKDNNNFISNDKLYLLSGKEIFNISGFDHASTLTRQLDYYKDREVFYDLDTRTGNNMNYATKQYKGEDDWWWLRTSDTNGENGYHIATDGGYWTNYLSSFSFRGFSPAFRIG